MKILILLRSLELGGSEKQAVDLHQRCVSIGIQSKFGCVSNKLFRFNKKKPKWNIANSNILFDTNAYDPFVEINFFRKNFLKTLETIILKVYSIAFTPKVYRLIDNEGFDLIISFSKYTNPLALNYLNFNNTVLLLLFNAGGTAFNFKKDKEIVKKYYNRVYFSCNSLHCQDKILKSDRIDPNKLFLLLNGIKKYTKTSKLPDLFSMLHVATFKRGKDHDTLLKALRELKEEGVLFKVDIFTKFNSIIDLVIFHIKIKYFGLGSYIKLYNNKNVQNIDLGSYHLGLLSTRIEGCSNTILEYLSATLPVVTTRIDANKEILGADYLEFMFEVGDFKSLKSIVLDAIKNKEVFLHMVELSRIAFKRYGERLSMCKPEDQIKNVYIHHNSSL